MKEFKLIGMTDFVLSVRGIKKDNIRRFWACEKYAEFLKQPLTLGMFVPVDENGNILKEPHYNNDWEDSDIDYFEYEMLNFNEACEKVLFLHKPQFEIEVIKHHISQNRTVEYLANFGELELTESAIKQIGL